MRNTLLPIVAAVLTACAPEALPTSSAPETESQAAMSLIGAELDLSGPWSWSERTHIRLREPAVAIFGIAAEGPITHLECEAWGELTIVQGGAAFTGNATQSGWCTTRGGQSFDPSGVFPPALALSDGQIVGRSMSFAVDAGAFPCLYQGSVRVSGGQVVELEATGHCEVPKELGGDRIWWRAERM
jgi:hypothetical protein